MSGPPYEKAINESAKAVQSVANTAGKAVDSVNGLGRFLGTVLGRGFEELGGAFGDWAAMFRYSQALKLADKVGDLHKTRRVEGRTITIPPRLGIPLIQAATLEDDETLLNMWAGLIANATDPSGRIQARRTLIVLLGAFEPIDALVLLEILQWKRRFPNRKGLGWSLDDSEVRAPWPNLRKLSAALHEPEPSIALSLENLDRMRLIFDFMPDATHHEERSESENIHLGTSVPITHEHAMIDLTHSGLALLEACATD